MPRFRSALASMLLLFAVLSIAAPAQAEPTEAERDKANELMDQGDALIGEQRDSEALSAYQAAHKIMGVPTTGIEVAKTLARLGKLVAARKMAREVSAMPVTDGEPEPFVRARQEATALAKTLDGRVAVLRMTLAEPARVTLDGAQMPEFRSGQSLELDPGVHVVVARAEGATSSTSLTLVESEHRDIVLKFPARARPPLAKPSPARSEPEHAPAAAERSNTARTLGWVSLAVGGAGVVFGAVSGGLALSQKSKLDDGGCSGTRCSAAQAEQVDRYNTLRTLSSAGFIGGAVFVGAGALLLGLAPEHSDRTGRKTGPRISATLDGAGFAF